ncbi:nuclear transport factor 2 family protein [Microbulbifer sp. VTAC004]|uniref:nuclear transport factor 2 family protein n=1 Tax=Microbulbifer TaxID=48073 RepID=UPI00035CDC0A|nr:nuclear transport factor 2 family protein [Microbulbifer variabilis]
MNSEQAEAFLDEMAKAVCDPNADSKVTDRYFTEDFVQEIDDTTIGRSQLDSRINLFRMEYSAVRFDYLSVIGEGDRIADVHLVRAKAKDGQQLTIKVISLYTLRDGRISRAESLSRLIEGNPEDLQLLVRGE